MCYAIPGRLIEKNDSVGVIDYYGEKKKVKIACPNAKEGDYVYAQGGILINRIPEAQALEIIDAWRELFFALKETDKKLAETRPREENTPADLLEVIQRINLGKELSREDLKSVLQVKDPAHLRTIYDIANNIRQRTHGNACCVHGIIEFSNVCANDCFYCGIRRSSPLTRYRMTPEEIIDAARYASGELGFKALVLQSGEDAWYDDEKLSFIVSEIRKLGILVFLSIGSRSKETYKRLYEDGALAALLRFETADRELFKKLRPGTELSRRVDLIRYVKSLGYVLATGFISGLPGETHDTVIDNVLLTRDIGPEMYSFGPFIPAVETPLSAHVKAGKDDILKTIAISRFCDRDSNILVTTALETLSEGAKKEALLSGANSLMINVTPPRYKELYHIYNDRAGVYTDVKTCIKEDLDLLYSLGRAPTDLGV